MKIEEYEKIIEGIHRWSEKAIQHDWINQENWWMRFKYWILSWKHIYPAWDGDDEIASSIMSHIGMFDIKQEGDEIKFMTESEIENERLHPKR